MPSMPAGVPRSCLPNTTKHGLSFLPPAAGSESPGPLVLILSIGHVTNPHLQALTTPATSSTPAHTKGLPWPPLMPLCTWHPESPILPLSPDHPHWQGHPWPTFKGLCTISCSLLQPQAPRTTCRCQILKLFSCAARAVTPASACLF